MYVEKNGKLVEVRIEKPETIPCGDSSFFMRLISKLIAKSGVK